MSKVCCVFLLAGLISASASPSQDGVRGVDAALDIRRILESHYEGIVAGFKGNDPEPWLKRLAPEFTLTLFNGDSRDRQWVDNYVRANARTYKVVELSMTIRSVAISDATAVATVEQKSKRTFTDGDGVHTLEVGAIQEEQWTKRADTWMLQSVREKTVLYIRRDGKSAVLGPSSKRDLVDHV